MTKPDHQRKGAVMKNTYRQNVIAAALACALAFTTTVAQAADKPRSIEYEMKVQRAAEAAIWAMPAVAVQDVLVATRRDLGGDEGDIVYLSHPMDSRHGFLTANDVTPYTIASLTIKDGPIVVEVPAGTDKVGYFGTILDAWQLPVADVGPSGDDQGKGGKYLLLPADYKGEIPVGYLVYRLKTTSLTLAFRPVASKGVSDEEVAAYAQTLKSYKLSEAGNPPKNRYLDAYPKKWNTLPTYDHTFFTDINNVIQKEPIQERDKAMTGILATLGIEKGKPFNPDAETRQALLEGLQRAYAWMQTVFSEPSKKAMIPWWEGRQWQIWNFAKGQPEAGFPYVTEDRILIDDRAGGFYFWATALPKKLGGGSFYLTGLRDKNGRLFDGTSTYRLRVPKDTPAKDFWSVIVYSMKTKGFVEGAARLGISSKEVGKMKLNDDGSVDVYFAPKAPAGLESNWIPTGESFFLLFRLYGPDKPLFDKSWTLGDVEKVK
jgi:hypothetical protein